MSKSINFNLLVFFFSGLVTLNMGCTQPIGRKKHYSYSLEQLAHRRGKKYLTPQNNIVDISQRELIIRAYKQDSTGNLWKDTTGTYNKRFLLQSFEKYPNYYLITDTTDYGISIMEIPLQAPKDSASDSSYIFGKYLGYMIDTFPNSMHTYLVINVPVSCIFNVNGQESSSHSDVIVLYEIQKAYMLPIEILDYRCSKANEYEKDTYKDICFCNMTQEKFIAFLQTQLISSFKRNTK